MQFDRQKNPAACCASEETGYAAIAGVGVVKYEDGDYLAATDGVVLSFVRCTLDTDAPAGIYPVAAFAAARKAAKRNGAVHLTLNGKATVLDRFEGTATEYRVVDGSFPDVVAIVPTSKPTSILQFNAEYLATVQKALGAQALRIESHGDDKPAKLVPIYLPAKAKHGRQGPEVAENDGSFAVLMPLSIKKPTTTYEAADGTVVEDPGYFGGAS